MKVSTRISQLAQGGILTLLLVTVLVVPLLFSPNLGAWRGVKPIALAMLTSALIGLALLQAASPRGPRRILEFLRTGPNLPIVLLVLYGVFSWSRSTAPEYSGAEWIRLACGAGLYFVVAASLRQREQVRSVVDVLMAVAILTSLFGFAALGQPDSTSMSSSFGNRQLFAGFLLMLVPLLLVLSFAELDPKRKIAAQVAAVVAVSSLLMAQTRSSWLGAIVALGALGAMAIRFAPAGTSFARSKHQMVLPLVIVVGALSLFLLASRTAPLLAERAGTLAKPGKDLSFAWRLEHWQTAVSLFRENILFGTGIGTYFLEQSRSMTGSLPRDVLERMGPSLAEQAHNEYLQTAAEMGIIGLGLHLWILGAFFAYGLRALRERESGYRRLILMGALAAMAGQAVDALSNPAWRFADVSFMYWLMMGLGVAAARAPRRSAAEAEVAIPARGFGLGRLSWQAASLVLTVATMGGAWAQLGGGLFSPTPQYTGPVELQMEPSTATLRPGQCVQFRLMARAVPTGPLVDVTDTEGTEFHLDISANRFCVTNNVGLDPVLGAAQNVFCVPRRACTAPYCGGPSTAKVNASFLSRGDSVVSATINITCP